MSGFACCGRTFPSEMSRLSHQSHHVGIRPTRPEDPGRVLSKIERGVSCWEWTAYRGPYGYGQTWWNKRLMPAHRAVYLIMVGPIPDGMHLDHLCRNRACVNPDHLEPVTTAENTRRGEPASRRACPHGHPYDKANTKRYDRAGHHHGGRQCLECRRERHARRMEGSAA